MTRPDRGARRPAPRPRSTGCGPTRRVPTSTTRSRWCARSTPTCSSASAGRASPTRPRSSRSGRGDAAIPQVHVPTTLSSGEWTPASGMTGDEPGREDLRRRPADGAVRDRPRPRGDARDAARPVALDRDQGDRPRVRGDVGPAPAPVHRHARDAGDPHAAGRAARRPRPIPTTSTRASTRSSRAG